MGQSISDFYTCYCVVSELSEDSLMLFASDLGYHELFFLPDWVNFHCAKISLQLIQNKQSTSVHFNVFTLFLVTFQTGTPCFDHTVFTYDHVLAFEVEEAAEIFVADHANSWSLEYTPYVSKDRTIFQLSPVTFDYSVYLFKQEDSAEDETDSKENIYDFHTFYLLLNKGNHLLFVLKYHFRFIANYLFPLLSKITQNSTLRPFRKKQFIYVFMIVKIWKFELAIFFRSLEDIFDGVYDSF